jgi:hypothetical protein
MRRQLTPNLSNGLCRASDSNFFWPGESVLLWLLARASVLLLLAAPLGYRLGVVPLRFALLTLLVWGAYLAIGATVVLLIGVIITLSTLVTPPAHRADGE